MTLDRECRKKDKRLLVLLAFGSLIILLNHRWITQPEKTFFQPNWLEIRGKKTILYRLSKTEDLLMFRKTNKIMTFLANDQNTKVLFAKRMKKNKAVSVQTGTVEPSHLCVLSPRLSFFLGQRLPVNTANSSELSLIPGIGPSLAGSIMKYRRQNGRIDDIQELTAVPGIGSLRAEKLTPFITFK